LRRPFAFWSTVLNKPACPARCAAPHASGAPTAHTSAGKFWPSTGRLSGAFGNLPTLQKRSGREEERLLSALRSACDGCAKHVIDAVFAEADAFTGGAPQFDDMTLVVLKVTR